MLRARVTAAIFVALAVGIATSCGGSSGSGDDPLQLVISHLPPDSATIDATDIAATRSDLGLQPDADATDLQAAFSNGAAAKDLPLQRLVRDTGVGFPAIGQELQGAGDPAATAAIDGSKISAAAGTGQGNIQVTAISTTQSFDEIAQTLTGQGFTREGNLLSAQDSRQLIGGVADGGDGIVILARSPQLAAGAVDEHSGPEELGDLIGGLSGTVRIATDSADSAGCVSRIAVGQAADSASGTVVVEIAGDADPSQVDTKTLDATDPTFTFSTPQAEGSQLRIDYDGPAPIVSAPTPLEGLVDTFGVYSAYNCK